MPFQAEERMRLLYEDEAAFFLWYNGEAPGRGIMMEMEDSRMVNDGRGLCVWDRDACLWGGSLPKGGRSVRGTPVHLVGERGRMGT